MAANPDMAQVLTNPSGGAPTDAAKAFQKLQKQGAVGLQDAAVLQQFASAYQTQKQQKQEAALKAQQLQQQKFILQEAQQKKGEEDAMNAKLAQMARIGSQFKGGVGAGVMAPQAAADARDFAGSPVGQMVSMGARVTPDMVAKMQELKMGNDARLQEMRMNTDSRAEVAGIRADQAKETADLRAKLADAQATAKAATQNNKDSATAFDETKKLRDEFSSNQNTKNFDTVDTFYKTGLKMAANNNDPAKSPSAANDIGLVYAMMKVYDPSSSVREGERADATNAASIPTRIRDTWNRLVEGSGLLSPKERNEFVDSMKTAATIHHARVTSTAAQYSRIAKNRHLDPTEVVDPSYLSWSPDGAPAAGAGSPQPQIPAPAPIKILSVKRIN